LLPHLSRISLVNTLLNNWSADDGAGTAWYGAVRWQCRADGRTTGELMGSDWFVTSLRSGARKRTKTPTTFITVDGDP
jgi:hypothetical protein